MLIAKYFETTEGFRQNVPVPPEVRQKVLQPLARIERSIDEGAYSYLYERCKGVPYKLFARLGIILPILKVGIEAGDDYVVSSSKEAITKAIVDYFDAVREGISSSERGDVDRQGQLLNAAVYLLVASIINVPRLGPVGHAYDYKLSDANKPFIDNLRFLINTRESFTASDLLKLGDMVGAVFCK